MTMRFWDELGDRDPLEKDRLEVRERPCAEESAMHLIGMPAYEEVDEDELIEELAIEEGSFDEETLDRLLSSE